MHCTKYMHDELDIELDLRDEHKKYSIADATAYFLREGYTKSQAKSLAWCEFFENKQAQVEYKYQGRIDGTIRIDYNCTTCGTNGQFIPDTVRSLIQGKCKGHNTKTFKVR